MKVSEINTLLNSKTVTELKTTCKEVEFGFASDLMSDVLTLNRDKMLLMTGLNNMQTIRTAEMAEIEVVIIVRNKKVSADMIALANENNICLIECPYSLFRASGLLFHAGIKPLY